MRAWMNAWMSGCVDRMDEGVSGWMRACTTNPNGIEFKNSCAPDTVGLPVAICIVHHLEHLNE
jgi:hypothetical protein